MSWQDELELQRELLAEIRDLLRDRLPANAAEQQVTALQSIVEGLHVQREQAESRERKLREALERFGDHLPGCAHWHDHIYPLPECSCGFHAALAPPPEEVRL